MPDVYEPTSQRSGNDISEISINPGLRPPRDLIIKPIVDTSAQVGSVVAEPITRTATAVRDLSHRVGRTYTETKRAAESAMLAAGNTVEDLKRHKWFMEQIGNYPYIRELPFKLIARERRITISDDGTRQVDVDHPHSLNAIVYLIPKDKLTRLYNGGHLIKSDKKDIYLLKYKEGEDKKYYISDRYRYITYPERISGDNSPIFFRGTVLAYGRYNLNDGITRDVIEGTLSKVTSFGNRLVNPYTENAVFNRNQKLSVPDDDIIINWQNHITIEKDKLRLKALFLGYKDLENDQGYIKQKIEKLLSNKTCSEIRRSKEYSEYDSYSVIDVVDSDIYLLTFQNSCSVLSLSTFMQKKFDKTDLRMKKNLVRQTVFSKYGLSLYPLVTVKCGYSECFDYVTIFKTNDEIMFSDIMYLSDAARNSKADNGGILGTALGCLVTQVKNIYLSMLKNQDLDINKRDVTEAIYHGDLRLKNILYRGVNTCFFTNFKYYSDDDIVREAYCRLRDVAMLTLDMMLESIYDRKKEQDDTLLWDIYNPAIYTMCECLIDMKYNLPPKKGVFYGMTSYFGGRKRDEIYTKHIEIFMTNLETHKTQSDLNDIMNLNKQFMLFLRCIVDDKDVPDGYVPFNDDQIYSKSVVPVIYSHLSEKESQFNVVYDFANNKDKTEFETAWVEYKKGIVNNVNSLYSKTNITKEEIDNKKNQIEHEMDEKLSEMVIMPKYQLMTKVIEIYQKIRNKGAELKIADFENMEIIKLVEKILDNTSIDQGSMTSIDVSRTATRQRRQFDFSKLDD